MHSITYSCPRLVTTVPVNIGECEIFVTFEYSLEAHTLSNKGDYLQYFAILLFS